MRIVIILVCALVSAGAGGAAALFLRGEASPPASKVEEQGNYGVVELQNQFVVPLTDGDRVTGLVAVSLAVEGRAGEEDVITQAEPRLRDAFLRVLFDHARADGFRGDFTNGTSMSELRARLDAIAVETIGPIAQGVLITSVARQDF